MDGERVGVADLVHCVRRDRDVRATVLEAATREVEDRRRERLRGAGVAEEGAKALPGEIRQREVDATLVELRGVELVARAVGLVRRQPRGRDRGSVRWTVDGRASRVAAGRG